MRRYLFRLIPVAIAAIVLLYQFASSERFTNPETGRVAHVGLSLEQESALGLQGYQQVLGQSEVVKSGPQVDQVVRVAKRLVAVVGDAGKSFDWEVSVIKSDQQNAFCLPGGKICVYTGILPLTESDAGLATVLGHEMAHATSRHGAQRVFEQNAMQTAMMGVQGSIGGMDYQHQQMLMGLLGAGAQYGVALPFSRKHESEADHVGLIYMARAGYDPHEAVEFWKRMEKASVGHQPSEFASDHPSHENRVAALEELLPKAMEEYAKSPHHDQAEAP